MLVTEKLLKWVMRFYPPLFFQRIWVKSFAAGYMGVSVVVRKSIFNKNYNRTIFGATTFAAVDPFYPILFQQILKRKGYNIIVWLKSAQIQYLKPGDTDLHFSISVDDATIAHAEHILNTDGKYIQTFPVEVFNIHNELCVTVNAELYVRNLNITKPPVNESNNE
jgi:hypothetical protein